MLKQDGRREADAGRASKAAHDTESNSSELLTASRGTRGNCASPAPQNAHSKQCEIMTAYPRWQVERLLRK
eukprot:3547284-Heterocapsa_arctica.AAC.1